MKARGTWSQALQSGHSSHTLEGSIKGDRYGGMYQFMLFEEQALRRDEPADLLLGNPVKQWFSTWGSQRLWQTSVSKNMHCDSLTVAKLQVRCSNKDEFYGWGVQHDSMT